MPPWNQELLAVGTLTGEDCVLTSGPGVCPTAGFYKDYTGDPVDTAHP